MFDFKSLTPSYEREQFFSTLDDLRKLGCSEDLINELHFGKPDTYSPYVRPEEWFWADTRRFGYGGPWLEELYRIAGGGFVNLPFESQLALLSLPVQHLSGQKALEKRGQWKLKDGSVGSLEDFALEAILLPGELGFNDEGGYLSIIRAMTHHVARSMFKKDFSQYHGVQESPPSELHVEQMSEAGTTLLKNPDTLFPALWPKFGGVAAGRSNLTVDGLKQYVDGLGIDFLTRMLMHYVKHGLPSSGHPDLTVVGPESIRFIEVKNKDKLLGTQADWVRNVARPLGLDFRVLKVVEERP